MEDYKALIDLIESVKMASGCEEVQLIFEQNGCMQTLVPVDVKLKDIKNTQLFIIPAQPKPIKIIFEEDLPDETLA